jgi:hypothetical protein
MQTRTGGRAGRRAWVQTGAVKVEQETSGASLILFLVSEFSLRREPQNQFCFQALRTEGNGVDELG